MIYQLVKKINSTKGWNLPDKYLKDLAKAISSYIDATDNSTKIEKKIINYYEYSDDVKALQQPDSPTIEKYQKYILKDIEHYKDLPVDYIQDVIDQLQNISGNETIQIGKRGVSKKRYLG